MAPQTTALEKITKTLDFDLLEEQIIFYRDHLDIAIEDLCAPIRLTRDQHVFAREFGNGTDIKATQSRGSGKTWLTALCCHMMCVLYPGTIVAVVSETAAQATIVLAKLKTLADQNPNIANEMSAANARSLVRLSKDKGICNYKNGSQIESFSIDSMRGHRAKIIVMDEVAYIDQKLLQAVVSPVGNYRRDISFSYNFPDYASKFISTTSACEKSNPYFDEFMRTLKKMAQGDKTAFACSLDYEAAVANEIGEMSFFLEQKRTLPDLVFQMEYGSMFVGTSSNSAFPYDITSSCRTLDTVEIKQPTNSKSRYIISLDIATSTDKDADNSIISVIKFTERVDGTFARKLVYMRSFHGKSLDVLADTIRKLVHISFPNTEKIIYDARGLGDSFDRFFDKEWIDTSTGKEYPPLVVDDITNMNATAIQLLRPFRAIQSLNQRIYTNLRVALEHKTIELPIHSKLAMTKQLEIEEESKRMSKKEMAIYTETDALILEMGNIVAKVSSSGNVIYDTQKVNQHKDRYSSLAMGNDYISELERTSVRRHSKSQHCVGIVSKY